MGEPAIDYKKRDENIKAEIRAKIEIYRETPIFTLELEIRKLIAEWDPFTDLREEKALFKKAIDEEKERWP